MKIKNLGSIKVQLILIVCLSIFTSFISGCDRELEPGEPIGKFYSDFNDMKFAEYASDKAEKYGLLSVDEDNKEGADLYITCKEDVPSGFETDNYIEIGQIEPALYVPNKVQNELEDAVSLSITTEINAADRTVYIIDLKDMLEKLAKAGKETGLTGSTIFGITDSNSYKLMIPDKDSEYRKMVVDTIIASLLDGKYATKENLNSIKDTFEGVMERCYTSSNVKDTAIDGTSDFIVLGPENWVVDFFDEEEVLSIKECSALKLRCYYKEDKEGIATTLYQALKDKTAFRGVFEWYSVYMKSGVRLPSVSMSDWGNTYELNWVVLKDYISNVSLNEENIVDVFGSQYGK